jgi:tRNA threonylcarbamoyladenosine biosynthesis protein TsaB
MQWSVAQTEAAGQRQGEHRLLLIDTCGEAAGVALAHVAFSAEPGEVSVTGVIEREMVLGGGRSSVEIVAAIREMLVAAHYSVASLACIGVVSGPGSFTGVRTGLAVAKGLCEAVGVPLALVSRLAVLLDVGASASKPAAALLDAGRGAVFLRDHATARESLVPIDGLAGIVGSCLLLLSEPRLAEKLHTSWPAARLQMHGLQARDALRLVVERWLGGGDDVAHAEPNYVRSEQDIYAKTSSVAKTRPAVEVARP